MHKKVLIGIFTVVVLIGTIGCGKETKTAGTGTETAETTAAPASTELKEKETATDETEKESEKKLFSATIVKHRAETADTVYKEEEDRSFPYAYVAYETFEPSEEMQKLYPGLSESLLKKGEKDKEDALSTLATEAAYCREAEGEYDWMYSSNYFDASASVQRSDDRVLSILEIHDTFAGGPHPFTYWDGYTYDMETGEQIPLSDMVTDVKGLPKLLLDHLQTVDESYEFTEEEKEEMLKKIEQYVADGELCWVLTGEAFDVFFNAYELQYYAFGPIFVSLRYEDFPELLTEKYRLPEGGAVEFESRFPVEDSGTEIYRWEELEPYYEEYSPEDEYLAEEPEREEINEIIVENPGWDYYLKDSSLRTLSKPPYNLKQKDKMSIMYAEDWSEATGRTLPLDTFTYPYYEDGKYVYYIHREDPEWPFVTVSNLEETVTYGNYVFSDFRNPPDTNLSSSFSDVTDMEILYAEAEDGILYAELGHRTYASAQPHTGYLVAVDLETGEVLWRSKDQVASANDILILEDTIITGYGFTDEKDYIYILDKKTGEVVDSYPVDTAPDYLMKDNQTLYCITYGSAYTFDILNNET